MAKRTSICSSRNGRNRKRMQRLWREEGLRVPYKRRKRVHFGDLTVPGRPAPRRAARRRLGVRFPSSTSLRTGGRGSCCTLLTTSRGRRWWHDRRARLALHECVCRDLRSEAHCRSLVPLPDRSSHDVDVSRSAPRYPNRTQAATPSVGRDTRADTNAGVRPAPTRDVLIARGREARRWMGNGTSSPKRRRD